MDEPEQPRRKHRRTQPQDNGQFGRPLDLDTPLTPEDFRQPFELLTPPIGAPKAEDWQSEPKDLPWQNDVRCRECNKPMWVRQPEKHDICEECGWLLREQIQDMHTQQRHHVSDRFVNPFMGSDYSGQSGSLPEIKK